MSHTKTGCCEICNQRTFDDFNQDGICFSCLTEIENEELICSSCEQSTEQINDDGLCDECAEPEDLGDGDFNARGGYTQSYINWINNGF